MHLSPRLLALCALAGCAALLLGCPKPTANTSASAPPPTPAQQTPPPAAATPPPAAQSVPQDIAAVVPLNAAFTMLSLIEGPGSFDLTLSSSIGAEETVQFIVASMPMKGYEPQDNPSRILEEGGLLFTNATAAEFQSITARVTLETSGDVTVHYEAKSE